MTECRSPELQDLLPDYAAELLNETQMAQLAEHVASCTPCADDLELLRVVQRVRPVVAMPDVARIVAALPAPPRAVDPVADPMVRDISTAPSMRTPSVRPRRVSGARGLMERVPSLRIAAVLGVLLAGAASVIVARQGVRAFDGSGTVVAAESLMTISALPDSESLAVAQPSVDLPAPDVSVSYGDLGNYTDEELQRMLDRLEAWDGAPNSEPMPSGLANALGGGPR
ncbi:zf-HC2 domain-containing protein [Gemmatimonas sp. UBA7669]|uniref:zf-HC2 domain-containing protein n=1 Tax=Gemmatimonas sp. UBA7669 TaxID=1946568 RepID=UPI0025C14825|nr:zf-HC2 domain-containing protein [Gemmatimonas sp. UBA7669]